MRTILNIDLKRHCRFSKHAEKAIKSILLEDYGENERQKVWDKACRIYESYLVDLPFTGAGENPMGYDICDYRIVPKDSEYAKKYPVMRRPDGFLVNGPDD